MAECGVTREGAAATRLGVVGVRADANDFQTGVVGCVPRGGKRQGSCRDECGLFDKATAREVPCLHGTSLRLRLDDVDSLPGLWSRKGLPLAGGPANVELRHCGRLADTEIQRQVTLREIARLAVEHLEQAATIGEHDGNARAETFAIRSRAPQPN